MGRSPRCYIPSFVEIGRLIPEKIFEGFYHIWMWWPSWSREQHHVYNFLFPCTQMLTYKIWLKMAHWFLTKASFNFLYVNYLGPRSRNDLDLEYSHTFKNSISCVHLPNFRSQAAIVSEKFTVFTFSYRKAQVTKFDLAVKKVKVIIWTNK